MYPATATHDDDHWGKDLHVKSSPGTHIRSARNARFRHGQQNHIQQTTPNQSVASHAMSQLARAKSDATKPPYNRNMTAPNALDNFLEKKNKKTKARHDEPPKTKHKTTGNKPPPQTTTNVPFTDSNRTNDSHQHAHQCDDRHQQ